MNERKTRTEYSARNTGVAVAARILAILMGFITRIVFTHRLSAEYVGVNGLFTDILNVLALSEMGIGTAITFALYKPIAENDTEKQKSLMRIYCVFYRYVAGIVGLAGLLLVPFLPYLMKDNPDIPGLTAIYIMYLSNSVLSYFLIYKKTLIEASQLGYIDTLFHTGFLILQNILQVVILLTTGNFFLFLAVLILCTLGYNIAVSIKAERMFPFLKDKNITPLPKEEKRDVFSNVRAMMMHKIGNVLVNNTDNILLAKLISSVAVGCYSNYYLVIGSVRQVLNQAFLGITASVGNMGVSEDRDHIKRVYKASVLAGVWMYGFAAIMLYLVIDPFIGFCFGSSYVFESRITLVLCVNFYLWGVRQATLVFRDSMGLFKYDRWVALLEAGVNLIVSIALGIKFGIVGVFLGTMISALLTSFWVEPVILFKYKFKESPWPYFVKLILYSGLTYLLAEGQKHAFAAIPVFNTEGSVGGKLFLAFFLRLICCTIITNLAYLLISFRTQAFKTLISKFIFLLGRRKEQKSEKQHRDEGLRADNEKFNDFSPEEIWLLEALKESLTGKAMNISDTAGIDYRKLIKVMRAHSVQQLIENQAEVLCKTDRKPDVEEFFKTLQVINKDKGLRAMQQIYLTKKLVYAFDAADLKIAVLKGVATAKYYGKPERRKSGDVDILLLELDRLDEAREIILSLGCEVVEEQKALHHIVFNYKTTNIPIELHTMMAEPFDNSAMNKYIGNLLSECAFHTQYVNVFGIKIPALIGAFHAYELLVHMLQHFLRAGFGLKLLCDWVVFWNSENLSDEEKEIYLRLVTESGVKGFSDMITLICVEYLGLSEENVIFMNLSSAAKRMDIRALLQDIFEGEEFGHANKTRMVALRGNGLGDYLREFHHQMRLNHPKGSKIVVFWPVLWIITYVVFVRNNRKLRGTDSMEIYKKAGRRGKIVKQMGLFK